MPAGPNRTRAEGQLRRLALRAGLLTATGARTSGAQVAPMVPTLTTDTARTHPGPVLSTDTTGPSPQLTRRGAVHIGGVVGVIILTTLLLYNVRSC